MLQVSVSAPGKVLIAGGYLVLDSQYSGTVCSVSARITSTVSPYTSIGSEVCSITVHSPQRLPQPALLHLHPVTASVVIAQNSNLFLTKSLQYSYMLALALRDSLAPQSIYIDINADSLFYTSQGKTGLGSSAALVAAVTLSLLKYLLPHLQQETLIQYAHNLAQFVHCAAQGKVGSGFDISSAFFGSQLYTRFSTSVLTRILELDQLDQVTPDLLLQTITSTDWDQKITTFTLPPFVDLVLGDVCGGSETPGMVKQVLKWKEECVGTLWGDLGNSNQKFTQLLLTLSDLERIAPADYAKAISYASSLHPSEWIKLEQPVIHLLGEVREEFLNIRRFLREMSVESKVQIEPHSQSTLLDQCMDLKGVICAGVPGAGGFDAVFALVLNPPTTDDIKESSFSGLISLENLWNSSSGKVCRLKVGADSKGVILTCL